MLSASGVPKVSYTPGGTQLAVQVFGGGMAPPIHAHSFDNGKYSQRSLSATLPGSMPPKSQKLPLLSIQFEPSDRPAGTFPAAGPPNVPYTPSWPQYSSPPVTGVQVLRIVL